MAAFLLAPKGLDLVHSVARLRLASSLTGQASSDGEVSCRRRMKINLVNVSVFWPSKAFSLGWPWHVKRRNVGPWTLSFSMQETSWSMGWTLGQPHDRISEWKQRGTLTTYAESGRGQLDGAEVETRALAGRLAWEWCGVRRGPWVDRIQDYECSIKNHGGHRNG